MLGNLDQQSLFGKAHPYLVRAICSAVSLIGSHFHKTKDDLKKSKLNQVNSSLTSVDSTTAENST